MRKAIRIIFIVVIIAALISTVRYCMSPYSTETVTYFEYEKSISGTGYILRDETIVDSDAPGVFEPFVNDGERVSRQARVGSVISGEPDDAMIERLNDINERIEDIEKSNIVAQMYQSDTMRIAGAVSTNVRSIREAVRDGDYARASELKKEVGYLKNRAAEIETNEPAEEVLAELYEQKADIENAIGGVQSEVYAPIAGIYTAELDGLETYGSGETMNTLTPTMVDGFKNLMKDYEQDPRQLCKITDNYNWYLTAVITEEEAAEAKVGSSVRLLVDAAETTEVDAEIYYISDEEDGRRVIIVRSDQFVDGITSLRNVDYKVILLRRNGLKIPTSTLRIEGEQKGVYILIDKTKQFKPVNDNPFRTDDDQYYIVNRNYAPPGSAADYVPLKEFDKVLLNPEDVR
ncbi:MAG: hypothetical protein J1F63_06500 [Oscillospiraceae bacterium]|nr:hypothetical protein [Oscillospiraceae bacterium]